MALTSVYCTGWEHQSLATSTTALGAPTTNSASTISVETAAPITGLASLRVPKVAGTILYWQRDYTAAAKVVWRARLKYVAAPVTAGDNRIMHMLIGTGSDPALWINQTTSVLKFGITGGTTVSGPTLTVGSTYLVELQVDVGQNPNVVYMKVDGTLYGPASGNAATSTLTNIRLGNNGTSFDYTIVWDDLILGTYTGTTGADPGDWWGTGEVRALRPSAIGTHSLGADTFTDTGVTITGGDTTSWGSIDDTALTGGADYVDHTVGTGGATYLEYDLSTLGSVSAVNHVAAYISIRNDSLTQTNAVAIRIRDSASDGTVFSGSIGSATEVVRGAQFATRPSGGGAWDSTSVAALLLRFGFVTDTAPVPRLYSAMLEVDAVPSVIVPDTTNATTPRGLFGRKTSLPGFSQFLSTERVLGGLEPTLAIGGPGVVAGDYTALPDVATATGAAPVPVLLSTYLPAVAAATGAQPVPVLSATLIPAVAAATALAPVPALDTGFLYVVDPPLLVHNQLGVPGLSRVVTPPGLTIGGPPPPTGDFTAAPAVAAATATTSLPSLQAMYPVAVGVATALAPVPVIDNQYVLVDPPLLFHRRTGVPGLSRFRSTELQLGGFVGGAAAADVTLSPAVGVATAAGAAPTLKADYLPSANAGAGAAAVPILAATYLPGVNAASGAQPTPVLSASYLPAVGTATGAQSAPTLLATYLPAENSAAALAPVPVVDNQYVLVDPPLLFRSGFGVVGLSKFISSEQSLGGLAPAFTVGGAVLGGDVTIQPTVNAASAAGVAPVLSATYLPAVAAASGAQAAPVLFVTYLPAVGAASGAAAAPVLAALFLPPQGAATGAAVTPVLLATILPNAGAATAAAATPTLFATILPAVAAASALAPVPVFNVELIQVDPPMLFRRRTGAPGLSRFISTELQLGGFVGGSSSSIFLSPAAATASGASGAPALFASYSPVVGLATGTNPLPTLLAKYLAAVNAATAAGVQPVLSATYLPGVGIATGTPQAPSQRVLYLLGVNAASGAASQPVLVVSFVVPVGVASGLAPVPALRVTFVVPASSATAMALLPVIIGGQLNAVLGFVHALTVRGGGSGVAHVGGSGVARVGGSGLEKTGGSGIVDAGGEGDEFE